MAGRCRGLFLGGTTHGANEPIDASEHHTHAIHERHRAPAVLGSDLLAVLGSARDKYIMPTPGINTSYIV